MPLKIVRNDIVNMECDAIVNAAKPTLLGGGGVDGAIHKKAGKELLAECRKLGGCKPGEAKITSGYQLRCKYVIHTVGPKWHGGKKEEEKTLASCYRSCLELAVENHCGSIAFPLISSGVYGYPKDKAFKVAVDIIGDFLLKHDMLVYLVVYDKAAYHISKKLFQEIAAYIDDKYIDDRREVRYVETTSGRPFFSGFQKAETNSTEDFEFSDGESQVLKAPKMLQSSVDWEVQENVMIEPPCFLSDEMQKHIDVDKMPMPSQKAAREIKETIVSVKSIIPSFEPKIKEKQNSITEEENMSSQIVKEKNFKDDICCETLELEDLMYQIEESFSQMLLRKINEKGMTDAQCYKKANIDRKLFSKIRNDRNYKPSKNTAIAFALSLELTLEETTDMLKKAGYALSRSSKFDIIIEYFIRKGIYNVFEINEVLFAFEQNLLGC